MMARDIAQVREAAREATRRLEVEKAALLYEALLDEQPRDVAALHELAYLYLVPLQREWEALEIYERLLVLSPDDVEALFWKAWGLLMFPSSTESRNEARAHLLRIIEIDPTNTSGYLSLA